MKNYKLICFILFFISITLFVLAFSKENTSLLVLGGILLTVGFLFLSINFSYLAYIINCLLLLLLPYYLHQFHFFFFYPSKTKFTVVLVCWIFIISIFDFLILAYTFKDKFSVQTILSAKKIKLDCFLMKYSSLLKILAIFILYIIIIFSVITTFGTLYEYLSEMFNEGIEGENNFLSRLDALYFSSTTFFTIGFGDIIPSEYSEITKKLVIVQACIGHMLTTILWPIVIIFIFNNQHKLNDVFNKKK